MGLIDDLNRGTTPIVIPEGKTLEYVLPKCLDEIIRQHRDQFSLRLSEPQDFETLPPMVSLMSGHKPVRATINDWYIYRLEMPEEIGGSMLYLAGINESTDRNWHTTHLLAADFENNLVLTRNSLYRLGTKTTKEPGLMECLHICAWMHGSVLGPLLSVPHIFY